MYVPSSTVVGDVEWEGKTIAKKCTIYNTNEKEITVVVCLNYAKIIIIRFVCPD